MERKSALSRKASLLRLSAISLANGMRSGSFRSLYRGQGIDFSGVREYLTGDDVRSIDWNVTARMCRPFVKVFEEEKELDVFLIVDTSLSMRFGCGKSSRLSKALECASLLTLASVYNSSPVGAVLFDKSISFSCEPKHGREQALFLLSKFEKVETASVSKGSALENALTGAARLLKKRTLVMVFSDFRTSGWITPFARLCRKHDVVAVRITDSVDHKLPSVGAVPFEDIESSYCCVLPTSSRVFQSEWLNADSNKVAGWKKECLRHGGIPFILSTDKDSFEQLQTFFSKREVQ